ncbi:hypothetical protein PV326_010127 [Microctonus aethiopoides]|nr:hypothetical protein PV326_010127 [Microctonus aethiopoides]
MDLNVCSRRVHDGFATIRSRPRSRPRALYRSDSEELLKEIGGPYTLPIVSANVPLASEKIHQVPRWSDMGRNKLLENYGTLRRSNKKSHEISNNSKLDKKIILNTFISQKETKDSKNISEDNVYDSLPTKINSNITKSFSNSSTDHNNIQNELDKSLDDRENYYDTVTVENLNSIKKSRELSNEIKSRQPIYDIPNVSCLKDKINHEQTNLITDGNYVPSGDLYRTTAKYIEDINKNLAEIDKSYEELGYASNTNSGYGVINRVVKSDIQDHEESLYRIRRKRNMAPMLPITSDFDENNDDKQINQNTLELRNTIYKIRPNSFGKLPPKLLPRSSSIENTSRHSTGSTSTTTSSTKSTESLYAISESLTNLQHNKITSRSPNNFRRKILPTKLFDDSPSTNVLQRNRSSGGGGGNDITTTLHTQDQSTTFVTLNSRGRILDPEIESDDETRHVTRPRVSGTLRRSRSRVDDIKKKIPNGLSRNNTNENDFGDRHYDTLPCRKTKVSTAPRPLHKSSEDVLDGERTSPKLERSCTSTIDIRNNDIKHENNFSPTDFYPLYLMDATDVILQSQQFKHIQPDSVSSHSSVSPQRIDRHMNNKFSSLSRTRHNSLESNDDNSFVYLTNAVGNNGFATLPRRRNATSSSSSSSSPSSEAGLSGKRHSGTVLEPLYEHAVSNPVKPRGNESTVIPWWELATRKYRHRSCPTLQVNYKNIF